MDLRKRHKMWILLDDYRRKAFIRSEWQRRFLRLMKKNKGLTYEARYKAAYYLSFYPRISASAYGVNRCVVSGRSWSVDKNINTCRFNFRREINASNLPGCSRASW